MACFGCNPFGPGCNGRRGCNRRRNRRQQEIAAAAGAAAAAALASTGDNSSTCTARTPAQELYAGPIQAETIRTCCDRYGGCREFPESTRDTFWPAFAHPRWLPCEVLYQGPPLCR